MPFSVAGVFWGAVEIDIENTSAFDNDAEIVAPHSPLPDLGSRLCVRRDHISAVLAAPGKILLLAEDLSDPKYLVTPDESLRAGWAFFIHRLFVESYLDRFINKLRGNGLHFSSSHSSPKLFAIGV